MRREFRVELNRLGRPLCVECGFDLRGATNGRCPECGAITTDLPVCMEVSGATPVDLGGDHAWIPLKPVAFGFLAIVVTSVFSFQSGSVLARLISIVSFSFVSIYVLAAVGMYFRARRNRDCESEDETDQSVSD